MENQKTTSGFIQMSLVTLQDIATAGGGYNDLAAYIVLCGGVNGRHAGRLCTHGAKSVSDRSGMSYRTAEKSISWLHENGFIRPPNETEPKFLGKTATRAHTVRWVIDDGEDLDVAVCRQFTDGIGGKHSDSPLKLMLENISGKDEITRGQAAADSIILFAALMREQDFAEFAGVDPKAWRHKFDLEGVPDSPIDEPVMDVPGTNAVIVTAKEQSSDWAGIEFLEQVFCTDLQDQETKAAIESRYWHAVHELRRLELIYRVLVLWNGNPLDPKNGRKAEPIATQYINDSWARKIDPFIQYETHKAADRRGMFDYSTQGYVSHGHYRYMVTKGMANKACLLGQLRCRYWPANESTTRGRKIEKTRTESYMGSIKKL